MDFMQNEIKMGDTDSFLMFFVFWELTSITSFLLIGFDHKREASRRAALRFGLSFEGVFRQAQVVKGRNRDTAWFAAIDAEWPALRTAFETWLDPANFDENGAQKTRLAELTRPILVATDPHLERLWPN